MTPHELITKLINIEGPCQSGRWCAYCDEQFETAEVKECVENMYKQIYKLQADKDKLLESLIKVRAAYRNKTGEDYQEEEDG